VRVGWFTHAATVTVIVPVVWANPLLVPVTVKVNVCRATVESTVRVRLDVLVAPAVTIVTGLGLNDSETPVGTAEFASVMVPVKLPRLVRLIVVELPPHDVIVSVVGLAAMVKSLTIRLAVPELVE
jgi:hypothetical protein